MTVNIFKRIERKVRYFRKKWIGKILKTADDHKLSFLVNQKRSYVLCALDHCDAEINRYKRVLVEAEECKEAAPVFWDVNGKIQKHKYNGRALSPEVTLREIDNASVMGRTEFIFKNGKVYYPSVINIKRDAFMIEIEHDGIVNLENNSLEFTPIHESMHVDAAISLLGQCSGNYAHWLTEILTRLVLVDEIDSYSQLPLLVDSPIHPNLMEALNLINKHKRKFIFVKNFQKIEVNKLIYISPASYVPPETRLFLKKHQLDDQKMNQIQFSRKALFKLRKVVKNIVSNYGATQLKQPKSINIYLPRKLEMTGNGRCVINELMVQQYLETLGYESVNIASYHAIDQMAFFQNVNIIVSPIGAVLANLIFSPPGKTVIMLASSYSGATYFYFSNLMTVLGHKAHYILGDITNYVLDEHDTASEIPIYNRNYVISLDALAAAMKSLNKK